MKYLEVKSYLEKKISALQDNAKLSTEAELMVEFGASRVTIRKAVDLLVEDGLVVRVQGSGAFVRKSTFKICVVYNKKINLYKDPFYSNLINLLEKELYDNKCIMQLISLEDDTEDFSLISGADGIIVIGSVTERVFNINKPCIILFEGSYFNISDVSVITSDEYMSGFISCEHLINLGHRHIMYAGNSKYFSSSERFKGVKDRALKDNIDLLYVETHMNYDGAEKIMDKLNGYTAIICANDWLAMGLINRLKENNISVPENISVSSFDNTYLSSVSVPSITTIDIPIPKGVKMAVKEIKEALVDNKEYITKKVLLPTKLIIKNSTSSPS